MDFITDDLCHDCENGEYDYVQLIDFGRESEIYLANDFPGVYLYDGCRDRGYLIDFENVVYDDYEQTKENLGILVTINLIRRQSNSRKKLAIYLTYYCESYSMVLCLYSKQMDDE